MLQTLPLHQTERPTMIERLGHSLRGRARLIVLAVLAIGLAALAWYFVSGWLDGGKKKAPPAPPVKVAVAKSKSIPIIQNTIGTVVAPDMVQITAQVTGKLLTAAFQEGQIVHRGDLLFQIDPAPFQAALQQAEGQLAKDQAQLIAANNDKVRYTTLFAQNAASSQQRDNAVATAASDAATVKVDEGAVEIARQNLGYTRIVSPIDGKTGPIMIQPGNLVTANATAPIVTITQVQPIKVSFFLPQSQLGQIQNQMQEGALNLIVPMPGAPNGHEKAKVDFVSNVVSATTGTIELRATFPNADLRLVPGQTVNVGVSIGNIANAVLVPRDAVNVGPDASFVYVVDKDSKVSTKTVAVLNDDGTTDAIKGDVKAGDKVVTDGQLRIGPGMKVHIQKGKGGPAPASSDMPQ